MRNVIVGPMAVVTALVAVGCVKTSTYKSAVSRYETAETALAKCHTDGKALESQVAERDRQISELETSLAAQKDVVSQTEKLLSDVENRMSATKEELTSLRKQRASIEKRLAAFKSLTDKLKQMIDAGKL